ncbi:hypothetical protein BGZ49_003795 [Haplosporangium sp. Z 27]|nr:hypothetical protein BGZ49_003795 [Haplosporangium sp. Z 27]
MAKASRKLDISDLLSTKKAGVGYFKGLKEPSQLSGQDYVVFRFASLKKKGHSEICKEWKKWIEDLKLCDSDEWRNAASMAPVFTVDNVKAWIGRNDNINQRIPSTSPSILEPTTALSAYSPETTSKSETASTSSESSSSSSSDKSANSQLKRKAIVYELELKDPSFSPPTLPSDSNIHAEFEEFQSKSKAIALATNSSLNFAFHKAEALALNGVWFAGKALLDSSEAKEITRSMRQEYHIPDFKEISDLTPLIECILRGESEQDFYEAFDSIASEQTSSRARRALNIWRQLADTLPSDYTPGLHDGELTFRNISLQPFLSVTFSARRSYIVKGDIEHDSVNEHKAGHKNGVRSDFFVVTPAPLRYNLIRDCVGMIGEVKPPEKAQSAQLELMDQWKIFRMMKDEINSQIMKGITKPIVWGCQVFGYDITFYVMDMRIPSIYCLMSVFKGTLPKSIEDVSSVARIISAFFTVEGFIANWITTLEILDKNSPLINPHLQLQPNQIAPKATKKNKTQPLVVQDS